MVEKFFKMLNLIFLKKTRMKISKPGGTKKPGLLSITVICFDHIIFLLSRIKYIIGDMFYPSGEIVLGKTLNVALES